MRREHAEAPTVVPVIPPLSGDGGPVSVRRAASGGPSGRAAGAIEPSDQAPDSAEPTPQNRARAGDVDWSPFTDWLRAAVDRDGRSWRAIEQAFGLTNGTLYNALTLGRRPRETTARRLAECFHGGPDEIAALAGYAGRQPRPAWLERPVTPELAWFKAWLRERLGAYPGGLAAAAAVLKIGYSTLANLANQPQQRPSEEMIRRLVGLLGGDVEDVLAGSVYARPPAPAPADFDTLAALLEAGLAARGESKHRAEVAMKRPGLLWRIVRGESLPTRPNLALIAEHFGWAVDDLIRFLPTEPSPARVAGGKASAEKRGAGLLAAAAKGRARQAERTPEERSAIARRRVATLRRRFGPRALSLQARRASTTRQASGLERWKTTLRVARAIRWMLDPRCDQAFRDRELPSARLALAELQPGYRRPFGQKAARFLRDLDRAEQAKALQQATHPRTGRPYTYPEIALVLFDKEDANAVRRVGEALEYARKLRLRPRGATSSEIANKAPRRFVSYQVDSEHSA